MASVPAVEGRMCLASGFDENERKEEFNDDDDFAQGNCRTGDGGRGDGVRGREPLRIGRLLHGAQTKAAYP